MVTNNSIYVEQQFALLKINPNGHYAHSMPENGLKKVTVVKTFNIIGSGKLVSTSQVLLTLHP